jgi:hypothetical protein
MDCGCRNSDHNHRDTGFRDIKLSGRSELKISFCFTQTMFNIHPSSQACEKQNEQQLQGKTIEISPTFFKERLSALYSILVGDWMETCVGKKGVRQQIIDRSTTLSVISALLLSIYMPMIFQVKKIFLSHKLNALIMMDRFNNFPMCTILNAMVIQQTLGVLPLVTGNLSAPLRLSSLRVGSLGIPVPCMH